MDLSLARYAQPPLGDRRCHLLSKVLLRVFRVLGLLLTILNVPLKGSHAAVASAAIEIPSTNGFFVPQSKLSGLIKASHDSLIVSSNRTDLSPLRHIALQFTEPSGRAGLSIMFCDFN